MFRVNDNHDRVDYGDLLLPPQGFHVSFAVGTTYSLDLEALSAVCLSLGLTEETGSSLRQNPIALLNVLQKISKKMIVFCDAGQIKMPANPSALSLLLEKIIVPVILPKAKGMRHFPAFHPKTWLIEYENDFGEKRYRFAVMSRNLTFDRSWDVCFAMDGKKRKSAVSKSRPLAHYLEFLRDQVKDTIRAAERRFLPRDLRDQVKDTIQNARAKRRCLRDFADDFSCVDFKTDSKEFEDNFEIMPLGIGKNAYDMSKDPLFCSDARAADYLFHELVVFSPFLSGTLIDDWNESKRSLTGTPRVLVTRKSELAKFTKEQSNNFLIYTLQDDIVDGEEAISDQVEDKQKQDIHAKIYLRRKYSDVDLYLGSMNATDSAVNKNVEMMIRLRTKNRYYNTASFLKDIFCGDEDGEQNPFEKSEAAESTQDSGTEPADRLEQIVKAICQFPMSACVTERDGKYDVAFKIEGDLPDKQMYLAPFRRDVLMPLTNSMQFSQLDLLQLSEFYRLKVVSEDVEIERIIMVSTSGIPSARENVLVNSVVKDKRSFVEYVALIMGDDYLLSLMESKKLKFSGIWGGSHEHFPALYERMLKTALEDPERLNEIGRLLNMITDDSIIPDKFRELYETFRKTLKLK